MDAFEINFSCPHGMPERKMGMAMGQVGGEGAILAEYEVAAAWWHSAGRPTSMLMGHTMV